MKKLLLMLFMAAISLSCTKSNEPSSSELLPMDYGNYWIYHSEVINPDGSTLNSSTDSLVVNGEITLSGRVGKVFSSYIIEIGLPEVRASESVYAKVDERYYTGLESLNAFLSFFNMKADEELESSWLLIASPDQSKWENGTIVLDGLDLTDSFLGDIFASQNITIDSLKGDVRLHGESLPDSIYTLDGQKYSTKVFRSNYDIDILIYGRYSFLPLNGVPMEIRPSEVYHFIPGIGIALQEQPPISISIIGVNLMNLQGTKRTLIRYNN